MSENLNFTKNTSNQVNQKYFSRHLTFTRWIYCQKTNFLRDFQIYDNISKISIFTIIKSWTDLADPAGHLHQEIWPFIENVARF